MFNVVHCACTYPYRDSIYITILHTYLHLPSMDGGLGGRVYTVPGFPLVQLNISFLFIEHSN